MKIVSLILIKVDWLGKVNDISKLYFFGSINEIAREKNDN